MGSTKALARKKEVVDKLKEKIDLAKVIILSDYRGIPVNKITELRKKLFKDKSEYTVVKNSLLQRAFEAAGLSELNEHLTGPVGMLLGYEEPVAPLKSLVDFLDEIEKGEIKAGVFEKKVVNKAGLNEISKLPSREVLLAKVVGGMQAPIYGLVNVLQGNIRKLVYALNAIKEKKGG